MRCILAALAVSGVIVNAAAAELFDASLREEVRAVRIVADVQRFEPRQSVNALGAPIHTSDYSVDVVWQPSAARASEHWQIETYYPIPASFEFTLSYDETGGLRRGSMGPLGPPGDGVAPIESARIGASFKDLWLTNPLILAAYAAERSVADDSAATETDGAGAGRRHSFEAHGTEWSVLLDEEAGLPTELSTIEVDPHEGRIANKVVFSDWREVSGIAFPYRLAQYTGDRLVRREVRRLVVVNPADGDSPVAAEQVEAGSRADFAWGWEMSHILLKRGGGGNNHAPQFDNVTFEEVGDGIFLVAGSTHHNLLIVGPAGLTLVDASWYSERSERLLAMIAERWPDKPLRNLILTHHHIDHTGGLRPVVEAGAGVVTSRGNADYFVDLFMRTFSQPPQLISVGDTVRLEETGRAVEVYDVMTSHADGMLAVYVPDQKLLFNADLYSPNRERQFPLWQSELMRSVQFHDLEVTRHVGGHGRGYVDVGP